MKAAPTAPSHRKGFTLLELSLVIGVLITLICITMYSTKSLSEWRLGRDASEKLRAAYVAQRNFLADNPTVQVNTLTHALLNPYLPNTYNNTMPTATSLTGAVLHVRVNVSPPYMTATAGGTSGARYDPSGSTTDSLWDVGQ